MTNASFSFKIEYVPEGVGGGAGTNLAGVVEGSFFVDEAHSAKLITGTAHQNALTNRIQETNYPILEVPLSAEGEFLDYPVYNEDRRLVFDGDAAFLLNSSLDPATDVIPDRRLFVAKLRLTGFGSGNDATIIDGTSFRIFATSTSIRYEVGNAVGSVALQLAVNTEYIFAIYTERTGVTNQWRLIFSVNGTSIERTVTTSTAPDSLMAIGAPYNVNEVTNGFPGTMGDIVVTCPNEDLSVDDLNGFTATTHLNERNNLYGLVSLGTNTDGTTATVNFNRFTNILPFTVVLPNNNPPGLATIPTLSLEIENAVDLSPYSQVVLSMGWRRNVGDSAYDREIAYEFEIRKFRIADTSNLSIVSNGDFFIQNTTLSLGLGSGGDLVAGIGRIAPVYDVIVHVILGSTIGSLTSFNTMIFRSSQLVHIGGLEVDFLGVK